MCTGASGVLATAGYTEAGNPLDVRGAAHLRVAAQMADDNDLIHGGLTPEWDLLASMFIKMALRNHLLVHPKALQ